MFMRSASDDRPAEDEIRDRRVEVARRNSKWTEIEEPSALVRRGRLYIVHADTDEVFKPYRGVVFATGSATVIADQTALYFYVRDEELTFLELEPGTWSDRVAKRAGLQHFAEITASLAKREPLDR
jgi:hypothetical protein